MLLRGCGQWYRRGRDRVARPRWSKYSNAQFANLIQLEFMEGTGTTASGGNNSDGPGSWRRLASSLWGWLSIMESATIKGSGTC